MSNELLQKIVDTGLVSAGGGGLLNPEQAQRFIDYTWDATVLGQYARRRPMANPQVDVDSFRVGQRIARLATEGLDDGENAVPTFSKVSLRTEKIRLDWEMTTESLEDNLAGDDLQDQITRAMATQLGNDLEDLAINGDVAVNTGDPSDGLMMAYDGYRKLALGGGHVLSHDGDYINNDVFSKAYKTLPRQYKGRRDAMKFFAPSSLVHDYRIFLANLGVDALNGQWLNAGGPTAMVGEAGSTGLRPFGIDLVDVPLFVDTHVGTYLIGNAVGDADPAQEYHGDVMLTVPDNLVWGVHREITMRSRYEQRKDSIEFVVFTRQGVVITNDDAMVTVENIRNAVV